MNNGQLTKLEATILLKQGETLTHEYFTENEWIKLQDGKYLFEDGVKCDVNLFWADRMHAGWQTGWRVYPFCTCNVNITNQFHKGNCIKCGKPTKN